jgi:hypothetical protein
MKVTLTCPDCEADLTADVTTSPYRRGMNTAEDAFGPEIHEVDGCEHAVSYNAGVLPARAVDTLEAAVIEALESYDDPPDRDD